MTHPEIYCACCKKKTSSKDMKEGTSVKLKPFKTYKCVDCGTKKVDLHPDSDKSASKKKKLVVKGIKKHSAKALGEVMKLHMDDPHAKKPATKLKIEGLVKKHGAGLFDLLPSGIIRDIANGAKSFL